MARQAEGAYAGAVAAAVTSLARESPKARLVLSGKGGSIQALRRELKAGGTRNTQKVKAYWAPGKTGLDREDGSWRNPTTAPFGNVLRRV